MAMRLSGFLIYVKFVTTNQKSETKLITHASFNFASRESKQKNRGAYIFTRAFSGHMLFFQFVIFKPVKLLFQKTIGFEVTASFASRPLSRLIR